MANEIELISDGHGIAIVGDPASVEQFLASEGLPSRDLRLDRLSNGLSRGASVAQTASQISENSGRWVQLTKESAEAVKKYGLMDTKTPGVKHAMVGKPGEVKQWIQIVKTPGSLITNPALLSGAAGIMTQMAMQQQMDQIVEYLETIDAKLDDVLRSQTNQVLARVDGVDLAIREAMSIRDSVGRVSEVTWSKVQSSASAILETQGYALRQLGDLADKLERKAKLDEVGDAIDDAKQEVQKWLSVLARCFQLHDAVAVLELDRVLDASPDELDRHRLGLQAARRSRLELITQVTLRLLDRMDEVAHLANSKVLLHPTRSPAIVQATNQVAIGVGDFHEVLGLEAPADTQEARRWTDAAGERWDQAREMGAEGVTSVRQFGTETLGQAKSVKSRLADKLAERRRVRADGAEEGRDGSE